MPVEIREVVLQARIIDEPRARDPERLHASGPAPPPEFTGPDGRLDPAALRRAILSDCEAMIRDALRRRRER